MSNLAGIESLTRKFSAAWNFLKNRINECEAEKTAVVKRHAGGIKNAINKAKEIRFQLEAAIDAVPELFESPRTLVIDGIRIGMQKGKGKLIMDSPETTIKLIHKHYPHDAWDALIKTTETPVTAALIRLSASDLKKLGCEIGGTGDEVIIKTTDTEIEKIVKAMMKEDTDAGV
jgi:hypothetical protein